MIQGDYGRCNASGDYDLKDPRKDGNFLSVDNMFSTVDELRTKII